MATTEIVQAGLRRRQTLFAI